MHRSICWMASRCSLVAVSLGVCAIAFADDTATPEPPRLAGREVATVIDSGWVRNDADTDAIVFEATAAVDDASWVRLRFDEVTLGLNQKTGEGAWLQLTSLDDGAVQMLDAVSIEQWRNTSAYFNGNAVKIEIIAPEESTASRVRLGEITASNPPADDTLSICGPTDDRMLSTDPRAPRNFPIICTSWMFDDCANCFGTAGHCVGFDVIQFNVPLSNSNGSVNHPGPEDQYAVDTTSMQSQSGSIGNDWAYYGVFENSNTGLTPAEAQGSWYALVEPPNVSGQMIRITGYGVVSSPVPGTWNRAQKTHVGPYVSRAGTRLRYATDTTGSNSGSPVIEEGSGNVIGVHTHAGCNSGGGSNSGTGSDHPNWVAARANPRGVCCDGFGTDDFVPGLTIDCNNNMMADSCEIAAGMGVDCNNNGQLDDCEIASGAETDCDGNMIPDSCDIAAGLYGDCNENNIPDFCEVGIPDANDCDMNGTADACEMVLGLAIDCDDNGLLDSCEIASGAAMDCDENGINDICDIGPDFATQSPSLGPIGTGVQQSHMFDGLVDTLGDVTLTFISRGDFGLTSESLAVTVNGSSVGTVFGGSFTDCVVLTESLTIDAGTFNALLSGGEANVVMNATSAVNPNLCNDGSFVVVKISYEIENRDQNGNGVLDVCDTLIAGDMNCDGVVSVSDIGPFVLAVTDPAGYAVQFPDCDILAGDFTNDGAVTVADIGGFVAAVSP